MADKVTISAVIPAFNSGRFLAQSVASIQEQTYRVAEIIIVDDGSTDDTEAIVANLDGNIRYVRQENSGPSAARNRGLSAALGEWVAFLDADDWWTPRKIAHQLQALGSHPELVLIASDMAEVNQDGEITVPSILRRHNLLETFEALDGRPVPNALAALMRKNFIPTGTVLVKRAVVTELGGFNNRFRYGEDLELWGKIAARYPIACLPEVHMFRRQHGANATQATTAMLSDLICVMQSVRNWGGSQLERQGINPNRLVADAWCDFAYWHFHNEDLTAARQAFKRSLHDRVTARAAFYTLLTGLPKPVVYSLRQIKQRAQQAARGI